MAINCGWSTSKDLSSQVLPMQSKECGVWVWLVHAAWLCDTLPNQRDSTLLSFSFSSCASRRKVTQPRIYFISKKVPGAFRHSPFFSSPDFDILVSLRTLPICFSSYLDILLLNRSIEHIELVSNVRLILFGLFWSLICRPCVWTFRIWFNSNQTTISMLWKWVNLSRNSAQLSKTFLYWVYIKGS